MGTLTNKTTRLLGAWGERIPPGESREVDDKRPWHKHLFVKEKMLSFKKGAKSGGKPDSKPDPDKDE